MSGSGKNTAPTKYALCRYDDPNYFQMRFVSFGTAENFTLSLAHHYQDSEYAGPLSVSCLEAVAY